MNLTEVTLGLIVGVVVGVADFSFARSIAAMIRPSNIRLMQAVMLGGFILRMGLIGVTLWLLSRSGGIDFLAVCIGLVSSFTIMTVGHAVMAIKKSARERAGASK
jgi:hypothetical protein